MDVSVKLAKMELVNVQTKELNVMHGMLDVSLEEALLILLLIQFQAGGINMEFGFM